MQRHCAALTARNAQNMRWKKISYRELFVQARVLICKSPSRSQCVDEPVCFGGERGPALLAVAVQWARLAMWGAAGGVNEAGDAARRVAVRPDGNSRAKSCHGRGVRKRVRIAGMTVMSERFGSWRQAAPL
jgi:hypothetical protein